MYHVHTSTDIRSLLLTVCRVAVWPFVYILPNSPNGKTISGSSRRRHCDFSLPLSFLRFGNAAFLYASSLVALSKLAFSDIRFAALNSGTRIPFTPDYRVHVPKLANQGLKSPRKGT